MTTTFLSLSLSFNDRHLSSSHQDLDNPWIVYNQRSFFESVSTNLVPDEIILGNNVQFVFRCTRLGTHQSFQSDETKVSAESRVQLLQPVVGDARGEVLNCTIVPKMPLIE